MIIAIDFDGTVVKNDWPNIGKLRLFAVPVLKWLNKHHYLILYTCREGMLLREAEEFLWTKGIGFRYVNVNLGKRIREYGNDCRKISADLYIDDRAVGYWNWPLVFISILGMMAWQKINNLQIIRKK